MTAKSRDIFDSRRSHRVHALGRETFDSLFGRLTIWRVLGSVIAQLAFWPLLGIGVMAGEIRWRGLVAFVLLWMFGVFGLVHLSASGSLLVTPYVAVLDIVLILIVFKADVRLS